jgi:hypothetical protein
MTIAEDGDDTTIRSVLARGPSATAAGKARAARRKAQRASARASVAMIAAVAPQMK